MRRIAFLFLIGLLFSVLANVAFSQENGLVEAINELADRLAFANEGYVRSVSGDMVYIDLGQDSGIFEGMRFEVVRLGEPIVSEGVIIGHQEEIIGEIEITRVRAQMSIASIINKSKEIVEGDKVYQLTKQISRIAITEFPYGERFNDLSKDIEDRFYTAMIQRGVQVVERKRLNEILAEQAKEWTGLFDLSSAAELGKLLGVEGVLIGSITDQGETLAIRGRLVDVETAQAITAAAVSINKTPSVLKALSSGIRESRDTSLPEAHETALGEQGTAEGLLFFDDFTLRQDERWNIKSGTWTGIDGQFTPLERETDTSYAATLNIGKRENYTVEVDVHLGNSTQPCYAFIYPRMSEAEDTAHNVLARLFSQTVSSLSGSGIFLRKITIYTGVFAVAELNFNERSPVHVKIAVNGGFYTVYIGNKKISQFDDPLYEPGKASCVGLGVMYIGTSGVLTIPTTVTSTTKFDNFLIKEIP
jgi:TolB-like protein